MKDIQEIMKEMNNLSEQIAVKLNEEDTDIVSATPARFNCADCDDVGGENACEAVNRKIKYCCFINVPEGFNVDPNDARIIYDLNCLNCIIEECICNGYPRYDIKVVGSISYITNVRVDRQSQQCRSDGPVFLCCHDCVCVNNVVCRACTQREAVIACDRVQRRLRRCNQVTATINAFNISIGPCDLVVTFGKFTLPNCLPAPAPALTPESTPESETADPEEV